MLPEITITPPRPTHEAAPCCPACRERLERIESALDRLTPLAELFESVGEMTQDGQTPSLLKVLGALRGKS